MAKKKKDIFSTYEAKTSFSKLLKRVLSGEEIFISNRGKPIAKLVPLIYAPEERKPGSAKGSFVISDDFNDPLPQDILDSFYGN
jgi:prevent-host-death family protein